MLLPSSVSCYCLRLEDNTHSHVHLPQVPPPQVEVPHVHQAHPLRRLERHQRPDVSTRRELPVARQHARVRRRHPRERHLHAQVRGGVVLDRHAGRQTLRVDIVVFESELRLLVESLGSDLLPGEGRVLQIQVETVVVADQCLHLQFALRHAEVVVERQLQLYPRVSEVLSGLVRRFLPKVVLGRVRS